MKNTEELKLIRDLKRNRENSYERAIEMYGDKLLKIVYLIIKDLAISEEIVQETFLKVFKNIHSFKGNSSLYTWIYQIALNLSRDHLRRNVGFPIYNEYIGSEANIEDTIINDENREILKKQISKLNDIYRESIILFYFEEMSISEISEVLEEKEGTIKSRLSRARSILRESMEEEEMI